MLLSIIYLRICFKLIDA